MKRGLLILSSMFTSSLTLEIFKTYGCAKDVMLPSPAKTKQTIKSMEMWLNIVEDMRKTERHDFVSHTEKYLLGTNDRSS